MWYQDTERGGPRLSFDWNLFDQALPFFPPVKRDGRSFVKPSLDILVDGAQQWENALLGIFLGKSPPLGVFQKNGG
ncbi:hypothetical protein V6N13_098893 [Hibiscus sabdariffa]